VHTTFPSSAISRCNHVRFTYQGKTRVYTVCGRVASVLNFSLLPLLNVVIFFQNKLHFSL
jgi:hypothetical protein